jgi:arylsulfatase A-like enzyme
VTNIHRGDLLKMLRLGAVAATLPVAAGCTGASQSPPPNFVFFLIDDLGWVDTGVYGSSFYETPNIDRLASEGMRFTDAYAASPVCSPTRASILTGKHPARLNITDWIGGSQRGLLLPAEYEHQLAFEEITLAEVLGDAGYATGFFGKWHLGDTPFLPESQGFDLNVGGTAAGQPASYFYPYKAQEDRSDFWDVPHLEDGEEGEYLTDRLTDEAISFLEAQGDTPFLLYLSHYAVHTPIQSKEELTEKYSDKAQSMPEQEGPEFITEHERAFVKQFQDHSAYAGMIQSVDESVGRVLQSIDALGLMDNTIVIFMSDNGGLSTIANSRNAPTAVLPLRAGKGWLYEGGIREPLIVRWPRVVAPGSLCSEPVTSTDFLPTMLEMAGLDFRPDLHPDGSSLVPLLRQDGSLSRDAIFWHFPHYHGSGNRPSGAVRAGDYKLVEWFEDGQVELYNLREDIGESNDLSDGMPEKAAELTEMLHTWRQSVDAHMPRADTEQR